MCFVARRRENSSVLRETSVQCVSCYWRSTLARTAPPAAISASSEAATPAAPFASAFSGRSAHAVVRVKGLRLRRFGERVISYCSLCGDGALSRADCAAAVAGGVPHALPGRSSGGGRLERRGAAGDTVGDCSLELAGAPRLLQHGPAGSNATLSRALAAGIRSWTL